MDGLCLSIFSFVIYLDSLGESVWKFVNNFLLLRSFCLKKIMILFLSASWRTESRFAQKPCRVFTLHNTTRFTPNASFYCSVAEGKPLLKNGMIGRYQYVGYSSSSMTTSNFCLLCSSLCCYLEVQAHC